MRKLQPKIDPELELVDTGETAFESLVGKVITCFCANYFYTGKLVGINSTCIEIQAPKIIFETGAYNEKEWKHTESLPNNIFISTTAIEAFGVVK